MDPLELTIPPLTIGYFRGTFLQSCGPTKELLESNNLTDSLGGNK